MAQEDIVVGLDLGTTKICAIIAERGVEGQVKVIGVGNHPSEGLRRGVVVDVEKTVESIKKAVGEAELMAGVEVGSVFAGIAGEHVGSANSHGLIAVGGEGGEVSSVDRERVIEAARAVAGIASDREILHLLPQDFSVDEQRGIRNPVGMVGARLEVDVHIVTGAVTSAQNICKSVLRAGIEVRDIVLEPLASSYAVLEQEERDMGVCLVDVGGGTTDVALFTQGSVRHTSVIGLGGQNVTNDVAIGLRTSWSHAESIKCASGTALAEQIEKGEMVEVPGVAGRAPRQVPRQMLAAIIEPRMEEVFALVRRELVGARYGRSLTAGIVLTGGGALLEGAVELAEKVFELPVRLGIPRGFTGMADSVTNPIYATALGLALFGVESQEPGSGRIVEGPNGLSDGKFESVLGRMKDWFQALT
jgi:cell division protein FtsA